MKLSNHNTTISSRTLGRYLQRFPRANILVIGDLILDQYIWGNVHRVSPEAPVPVVHVNSETYRLGGAANVYNNIRSLGGKAELCGVVGNDEAGKQFTKIVQSTKSPQAGIFKDSARPTIKKTRVVAHNQQIVRFDVEFREPLAPRLERKIIRYLSERLPQVDCVVISDYAKGMITGGVMDQVRNLGRRHRIPIVVDPKVEHWDLYSGVTVITPNHLEASHAAGFLPTQQIPIERLGKVLLDGLQCQAVVITRGEEGMSIFEQAGKGWTIPAVARQVFDVTGAGDTVVSTLALALSANTPLLDAAVLANQAAGLVVGEVGTATVTRKQLQEVCSHGRA